MNEQELRKYIRENLEIIIEWEVKLSPGNNQTVGLKFRDEDRCFTKKTVYIPEDD